MDDFTRKHLERWVDYQFGEGQHEIIAAMVETFEEDPELYVNAGWWRCHDDMIAAGRHTL